MASAEEYKIEDGLYYTKEHEWAKLEGDTAVFGVSDYAQKHLGDIVFAELPEKGAACEQGKEICVIESAKAVASVYAPFSGEVAEINEELANSPKLINDNPYGAWIAKIKISNAAEKDNLMDSAKYREFTASILEKK